MWLFYVSTQRNGTPTFEFFSLPLPPCKFSRGFRGVGLNDSVKGSNSLESGRSGACFHPLGDNIGDKSILRGIKGGYFKSSLFWSIVVSERDR